MPPIWYRLENTPPDRSDERPVRAAKAVLSWATTRDRNVIAVAFS